MSGKLTTILIWAIIIGAIFGILWWAGLLKRISLYCRETMDELKKCSWPTWAELKGSTVVVMIAFALLGFFTFVVDLVAFKVLRLFT